MISYQLLSHLENDKKDYLLACFYEIMSVLLLWNNVGIIAKILKLLFQSIPNSSKVVNCNQGIGY